MAGLFQSGLKAGVCAPRPALARRDSEKILVFPLLASDCQERQGRSGDRAEPPATAHFGEHFICILKALRALRQVAEGSVNRLRIARHMLRRAPEIGLTNGIADANVH
jgi:hypothetical protein